MSDNEYRRNLLDMQVVQMRIQKALQLLDVSAVSFEFDNDLDISEIYLGYALPMEQIYLNAISTLDELQSALCSAITDMPERLNKCTYCGQNGISDTKIIGGYTILIECDTCEHEILNP